MPILNRLFFLLCLSLLLLAATGCQSGGGEEDPGTTPGPGTRSITVSWNANRESGVNQAGGGYYVYIANYANFNVANWPSDSNISRVTVSYPGSGAQTPTSTQVGNLQSGAYFVKVVAFKANPEATASVASDEIAVMVP